MNPYENELLPAIAVSMTDASFGVVLALCALFMLVPFAMLAALVYRGIRRPTRNDRG
jgi:hypothetical protein